MIRLLLRTTLTICGLCCVLVCLSLLIGTFSHADRIIFLSNRSGPFSLYGMDIGHGLTQRLTPIEISWTYALSPDAQHILYMQTGETQPQLYTLRLSDGVAQPVTDLPGITPSWSPDSQQIAFSMLDDSLNPRQLYRINADGTGLQPLTEPLVDGYLYSPVWSPDGTQIIYQVMAPKNKISLHVVDADGGKSRLFSIPVSFDAPVFPTWSPDGRYIAYVGETLDSSQAITSTLCVADVETAVARCSDNAIYNQFAWSPDSASIAFVASKGYDIYEIRIFDVETAATRLLRRYGELEGVLGVGYPIWTPDGQSLIYEFSRTQNRNRGTQLHIINVDGSGERTLTSGSYTNISLTWWPGE